MREPVGFSPIIGKDFDNQQAKSLIRKVRILRNDSFEPVLYLLKDELEWLAAFWPGFYLVSTAAVPSSGGLIAWLRKSFRMKAKAKVTACACDSALVEFKARILRRKAIPIDGIWTDIEVTG